MEFLATWLSNWYVFFTSVSRKEADNVTRGGKARVGTAENRFHCCIKEGSKLHNIATDNRKLYFV